MGPICKISALEKNLRKHTVVNCTFVLSITLYRFVHVAVVGRLLESWRRQPTFRCVYADHLSLEASSEASTCVGDRPTPPTYKMS